MSSTEQKHYLDEHLDACLLFDTYFGADKTIAKKEMLEDPMSFLYKLFSSGSVKGETLINLSVGSDVSKTFVAADFFKNIILLESSDCCIRAIESWIRNEPGAAEQSHAAEFACSLTGQRLENNLVGVDFISTEFLNGPYEPNILDASSAIGGHLVMVAGTNISYYMVGQHKFGALAHNEEFMQKAVTEAGCTVVSTETHSRKFKSPLTDYESVVYFVCRKDRVV
eukprot:XP_017945119.1 PREDICTED: nicotinamide N-methyltransferase-like [Xenopus tropicalis]